MAIPVFEICFVFVGVVLEDTAEYEEENGYAPEPPCECNTRREA